MIKLNYTLNNGLNSVRPIFTAYINGVKCTCMLDTGADTPVYCKGDDLFKETFLKGNSGVDFYKDSTISGFGLNPEVTKLYNFDNFCLSDSTNSINYKCMKIAVANKPKIPCDFILSASMFSKMKYTLNYLATSPYLEIEAKRSTYGVGFNQRNDSIYIFSSDSEYEGHKDLAAGFRKLYEDSKKD